MDSFAKEPVFQGFLPVRRSSNSRAGIEKAEAGRRCRDEVPGKIRLGEEYRRIL